MASEPTTKLPMFYNDLMPLNLRDHKGWKSRKADRASWLENQHAVPLTVEEFPLAMRHFPIVFSSGENPVPLALFGLNEGINVFMDSDGKITEEIYLPAYVRRYPFLLARLDPKSDNMSLCFDPSSGLLGEFKEGDEMFVDDKPSDFTQGVMKFCENFEQAGQRTQFFVDELKKNELLMEGEVAIQRTGAEEGAPPFVYRGFKMVNQEKFKEVPGDKLVEWNKSGFLTLVQAHFLSLDLLRVIFAKQTAQGKGPGAQSASNGAAKS
ncbi:MAG TPA: SapC family protein [Sphingomonadaceae bacterium]|nr:SapC family protein [Sphingomonadaceae bacterium]